MSQRFVRGKHWKTASARAKIPSPILRFMILTNIGDGAFRLQNGERTIVIDPATGRQRGDITLFTGSSLDDIGAEPQSVALPGEYEFGGIEVHGWQRGVKGRAVQTYYLIVWDELKIAFIGKDGPLPDAAALEELERHQPEVVLLPMGTKEQADWSAKLVKELEPAVVIPSAIGTMKDVAQAFGKAVDKTEEKFTFKKKDLTNHDQTLIVLTNKNA